MHIFQHLVGQTIKDIKRRDKEVDYDFYMPVGLHFITNKEENELGLYIGVLNDGASTDITIINTDDLLDRNGADFSVETFLNKLKPNDELIPFIGEKILKIRLAKFITSEIRGETFNILNGTYAGVELITTNNKFTFYNNNGGCLSINEEVQIPLSERWIWNE